MESSFLFNQIFHFVHLVSNMLLAVHRHIFLNNMSVLWTFLIYSREDTWKCLQRPLLVRTRSWRWNYIYWIEINNSAIKDTTIQRISISQQQRIFKCAVSRVARSKRYNGWMYLQRSACMCVMYCGIESC